MKLRHGCLTLHLPLSHDTRRITDRRSLQQQTHTRSSIYFHPRLSWQARYEKQEFLVIASRKIQPMPLNYLLVVRDDTDPLNISTGNAALKDESVWSFSFQHARRNTSKRRNISSRASSSIIQNAIAMSKSYDKATGVSIFRPMNVQGNWTSSAGTTLTQWFSWQSAMIESSADVTYAHNVDLVSEIATQSRRSCVRNLYADYSLKAQCQMRKATFVLHGNFKWRNGSSRQENFHTFNVADACYGVSAVCPLPWKLRIESDMRMCHRWGYRDKNMNDGILLWDATLSRSLGRTNQFTLKLDAHDILRQTNSVRHTLNAMGQSETWYRTLPSYMLLRVGYQFHKKPKTRH
ncbi:MAG: outer membrane beta-barrel family protein [Bacteroidaceae bacterium]|nr:outer membrane beta-barrel family protein [Bacteroidaceae bacterium]